MLPAPLYSRPDAPLQGRATWVQAADGARLRTALFPIRSASRGSVIISPGRAEPLEKYAEVIGELQARRFTTLIHDWRGQGLSERFARVRRTPDGAQSGHARGWRLFLSDFSRVLDAYAERLPRPWIALGHSMGGGLTLLAMSEGEARLDGAVLSAAMLGLRLSGRPTGLVRAASAVMTLVGRAGHATPPATPRPSVEDEREGGVLTHDSARWGRFQALLRAAPELQTGVQTWGWLQFAFALTDRIKALRSLEQLQAPVTLVAAQRDRVVANAAQRDAAARLPNGRYVEVEGAFHEILMETDGRRKVFWQAFEALAAKVGA